MDGVPPSSSHPVFLSYAREDTAAAQRIAEALRSHGVEVWFDQAELRGGDTWDAKIRRQIKECALFIPIISAQTQERSEGYFRLEWKLAVERTHLMAEGRPFLAPVVVDHTPEQGAVVPPEFLRVHWTRLAGALPTTQFVEQVKRLLVAGSAVPHRVGLSAAAGVAPGASGRPRASFLPWFAVAAVVVAIGGMGYFFSRQKTPAIDPSPKPLATAPSTSPATPAVLEKSIAVLPFTNRSADQENAYFSDGIHEDILTNLAHIRDLHVISRTSVMEYRNTTKKIPQIARELGVTYLLEGSVQRAGGKVRVTGQLIRAAQDQHIWARSFDRDLTDIFAIQSELAQAIAAELSAVITPQEKSLLERRPTENLAAYEAFLRWREERNLPRPAPERERKFLQEALRLDPNFVNPWAELASLESRQYQYFDTKPETLARAKAAVDNALRLAPDSPLVLRSLGEYYYRCFLDYPRALEQFQRVTRLRPNDPEAVALIAAVQRRQRKWGEALASFRRAVELDPANFRNVYDLVWILAVGRRFAEARDHQQRLVARHPDDLRAAFDLAYLAYVGTGNPREVEEFFQKPAGGPAREGALRTLQLRWALERGDPVLTLRLAALQEGFRPGQATAVATVLAAQGDLAGARLHLGEFPARMRSRSDLHSAGKRNLSMMEALLGNKDQATQLARQAVELAKATEDDTIAELNLAAVEAWSGANEAAIDRLSALLRTPITPTRFTQGVYLSVHLLKHDPKFAPLRRDPRFVALLNDPKNHAPLF